MSAFVGLDVHSEKMLDGMENGFLRGSTMVVHGGLGLTRAWSV